MLSPPRVNARHPLLGALDIHGVKHARVEAASQSLSDLGAHSPIVVAEEPLDHDTQVFEHGALVGRQSETSVDQNYPLVSRLRTIETFVDDL